MGGSRWCEGRPCSKSERMSRRRKRVDRWAIVCSFVRSFFFFFSFLFLLSLVLRRLCFGRGCHHVCTRPLYPLAPDAHRSRPVGLAVRRNKRACAACDTKPVG